ncbi:MAG: ribonuclease P protein component [Planctomycetota bacterium]|jgi:ribonuclease P protein component
MVKKLSFSKRKRLLRNEDFKAVLEQNRKAGDGLVTLYVAENGFGFSRIGISVGKGYGNAVARNRLKRLMREVFRQNQHKIPQNLDYVIVISSKAKSNVIRSGHESLKRISFEQLESSFLSLVDKIDTNKC